jgi:hypothetical protein
MGNALTVRDPGRRPPRIRLDAGSTREPSPPTRPGAQSGRSAVPPRARAGDSTVSLVTAIAQPPLALSVVRLRELRYVRPRSRGRHRGFHGLGGLVGAGRVLGERIAGGCVGAGTRAAAEFPVGAPPAAAAEVGRPDPAQERLLAVDADDLVVSDVAEREGQEPGRMDLSVVPDEDDPPSVARALREASSVSRPRLG